MAIIVPSLQPGISQLLFKLIGANMNVTTDQAFTLIGGAVPANYFITRIRAVNASLSLTTAAGGVYDTASKGGTTLVAAAQVYSALTAATLGLDLTLTAYGNGFRAGVTPILSLTTGQGAAATCDFYIYAVITTGV